MSSTRLLDALAWYGLLAATVVPPLVMVGYPFLSFEVVLFAGVTAVPAVLLAYIVNSRSWIAGLLCAAVVSTYVVLYFGRIIPGVLAGAAAGAFTVLALRNPQVSLRISAFSLTLAALGAAPTPNSLFLKGGPSLSSSRSVIHIVLDEQSSEWGVPPNLVPASTRALLSSFYLERGFTYFERSYTLDKYTRDSVARILNPSLPNPGRTAVEFDDSKGTWALNRADL